jgi:hypothetical protein
VAVDYDEVKPDVAESRAASLEALTEATPPMPAASSWNWTKQRLSTASNSPAPTSPARNSSFRSSPRQRMSSPEPPFTRKPEGSRGTPSPDASLI